MIKTNIFIGLFLFHNLIFTSDEKREIEKQIRNTLCPDGIQIDNPDILKIDASKINNPLLKKIILNNQKREIKQQKKKCAHILRQAQDDRF